MPAGSLTAGRISVAGAELSDGLVVAGAPAETIAPAWRRWGLDIAAHVDATFVVWDQHAGSGVLARDRSGTTPVLFSGGAGAPLAFAGDPSALLQLLKERPAPDPAGIAGWLARGAPPVGRTLLAGVGRLLPGEHLRLGTDRVERARHWRPQFAEPIRDRAEAVEALRHALGEAVARAASPNAALLLSGGLDSTAVAALSPTPRPVVLHGAFPGDPEVDESASVDATVSALGLRGVRAVVGDLRPLMTAAAHAARWQAPLPTPNEPVWAALVERAAQDGADAILDGEGGDSVLGPAPFVIADLLGRGRVLGARAAARDIVGPDLVNRALWRFGLVGLVPAGPHERWRRRRGAERYAPAWLRPEFAAALLAADRRWVWKRLDGPRWWAERAYGLTDGLDASGAHDLPRRRAAAVGLPARHPLQDPELIELALRLDPALLHDPDRDRPLARDALEGIAPEHVRTAAFKPHFNAVQERWLLADRPTAEDLLGPDALVGEYVDLPSVREWLLGDPARHPGGRARWPLDTWRVLALELWLRELEGRHREFSASEKGQVLVELRVLA